jgi:hypothetical protein
MSRIAKILNHYTNEAGVPEIHFVDDLGVQYTLAYELDWILNYFAGHPMGGLSQVMQGNLEDYFKYSMTGDIDPNFRRYVNADFMTWKAVIELEFSN